jgi:hypothetical protein
MLAYPAHYSGKRDRFSDNLCRSRKVASGYLRSQCPRVQMDGTCGGAGGGIFLDTVLFQFLKFIPFHDSSN